MDRHSKLHPGSECKTCLGPQSVCCPVEFSCSNTILEGLQSTGCQEKADEWGYPTFNALFCTCSDPSHVKPTSQTILETATEYLGSWALSITADMINVARHEDSVYRAQATKEEDGAFRISGTNEETIPIPSILGLEKSYPFLRTP